MKSGSCVLAKRDNKYQLAKAKQESASLQENRRHFEAAVLFETKQTGADMPELMAAILKKLLKSVSPEKLPLLAAITALAVITYFMTRANSSDNSICNGTVKYGKRHVNVTCTESAGKMFQTGKSSYKNILESIETKIHIIQEQKITKCKMESVAEDENFIINLFSHDDPLGTDDGKFLGLNGKRILELRADSPAAQHTLIHENHHAFILRQNKLANRFPEIEKGGDLIPSPFGQNQITHEEKASFKKLLEFGKKRVLDYIELLKKQPQTPELAPLRAATASYVSNPHQLFMKVPLEIYNKWNIGGHIFHPETSMHLRVVDKYKIDGINKVFLVPSSEHYSKEMIALMDCSRVLDTVNSDISYKHKDEAIKLLEEDAFLHQIYEQYPELFKLLFPELLAHHETRTEATYKACLKR